MGIVKENLNGKLELLFRKRGNPKRFKANEMIFMENDKEGCLYYIGTGLVKLSMFSNEGKEKTLFILPRGQFFGEVALGDSHEYAVNAETLTETVTYAIGYKEMRELMIETPDLALELLKMMSEKMRLITQQVKDIVFYDITGRLASQIYTFYEQFGKQTEGGILIDLILTHQEIANLLGASRVTVTKTLKQFQEEGLIEIVNRKIVIIDLSQLMSYIR